MSVAIVLALNLLIFHVTTSLLLLGLGLLHSVLPSRRCVEMKSSPVCASLVVAGFKLWYEDPCILWQVIEDLKELFFVCVCVCVLVHRYLPG